MKVRQSFIKVLLILFIFCCFFGLSQGYLNAEDQKEIAAKEPLKNEEKLVIIWTSGDREVALKMVFMYTLNSKKFGWWKDITLVVWGPSAKLLAEDKELQEYIKKIKKSGVILKACKGCSDMYGVSKQLEDLGIIVKYMGTITKFIKEGRHILTF